MNITELQELCHQRSTDAGWWNGADHNIPEKLCLIHSEISEGMEGYRKGLMDDHLPHRLMIEVELGDAVIRIMDLAGYLGLDLSGAILQKLEYNLQRSISGDHSPEERAKPNGKKF